MAGSLSGIVESGPLLIAAGVSALAGLIGFLSPCILPLVPGYLAYVAGVSGADGYRPGRAMLGAALFVLGFSGVFVSGGVIFGQFGSNLRLHEVAVNRIFGIITIIFGLAFLGRLPLLQREWRLPKIPSSGLLGAPLLGVAFGFSWTPCLTPTFGTVYFLSLSSGAAGRGAFLSACYCFGLGIPFLVFAGAFGWVNSSVGFFRRHGRLVTLVGGGSLLIMGILLLTNQWQYWVDALRDQVGAGGFEF